MFEYLRSDVALKIVGVGLLRRWREQAWLASRRKYGLALLANRICSTVSQRHAYAFEFEQKVLVMGRTDARGIGMKMTSSTLLTLVVSQPLMVECKCSFAAPSDDGFTKLDGPLRLSM